MIAPIYALPSVSALVEEMSGAAMLNLARKEKHAPTFPGPVSLTDHPLTISIRHLVEVEGLRHFEAADVLNISQSKVSRICAKEGIRKE